MKCSIQPVIYFSLSAYFSFADIASFDLKDIRIDFLLHAILMSARRTIDTILYHDGHSRLVPHPEKDAAAHTPHVYYF